MGYPLEINNYTVFKAFSEGKRHPLYKKVKDAFKPFKLFVFILHNPEINTGFDKYINKKFPELDSVSGKYVLFFSIINKISPEINEFLKSKHFHFKNISKETTEFFQNQNNYLIKERNSSAYFLSKLLNINFDNLPIIILTDNLESNTIFCAETNENVLLQQLSLFGNMARMREHIKLENIDSKDLKSYYYRKIILDKKISDYLSIFYSTAASMKFENSVIADDMMNNYRSELINFDSSVKNEKKEINNLLSGKNKTDIYSNEPDIFNEDFYNKNILYLTSLSLKSESLKDNDKYYYNQQKRLYMPEENIPPRQELLSNNIKCCIAFDKRTEFPAGMAERNFDLIDNDLSILSNEANKEIEIKRIRYIDISVSLLERESKIILDTSNSVAQTFVQKEGLNKLGITELDFSPLIICLTKIFEIETSLSVIHWVRKKLKVHLPEYFNRYEPGISAKLKLADEDKSFMVNFNKGSKNKWIPPGLGQSEIALYKLKNRFKRYLFFKGYKLNLNMFLEHWKKIRTIRNNAAHTELLKESDYIELQNSLITLNKNSIFNILHYMKNEFRGIK